MSFQLYTGNNLDELVKNVLCEKILSLPLSNPFIPEKIIVQSRGMASWLKQKIADYTSAQICANYEFPFLNKYINEILQTSLPDSRKPDSDLFTPDMMTWKIYSILEKNADEFPELHSYLYDANADLKRYQLSEKISETFDQYVIYRPEMILSWEQSPSDYNSQNWQAKLWNKLVQNCISPVNGFYNYIHSATPCNFDNERVIIFGISYMPLLFLDFFKKLGQSTNTDVHFIYLNPCQGNWYYNLTDKQVDKYLSKSTALADIQEEELIMLQGNKLLSNYGQAGREFFGAVLNITEGNYDEDFSDIGADSLLHSIQSDILNNCSDSAEEYKYSISDNSIKIHSCHSKTREVETLYDNLLNYIEGDQDIQPRDIFVMAPDISAYAPIIKSVFNSKNNELDSNRQLLPFSLSDVNVEMASKIIKSFFDILNLNYSKFKITEILDILETTAIHEAFEISSDELDIIRKWVVESGMKWGIDDHHRAELGLPSFYENSIQFALDRMLLGYAIEVKEKCFCNEKVPYNEIELSNSLLLGKFSAFLESLIKVKELVSESDTLENWISKLHYILNNFFIDNNESYREILGIRKVIDSISDIYEHIGYDSILSFDVIKYYFSQKVGNEKMFEGFLRGKITFCTMQPMRAVPAKLICLLGMNEGAFPREDKKVGFNILDKNVRFCDKSKTIEDRYIFLESLLAAKDAFYMSYIGIDNKTNEETQPSIIISEFLDYLQDNYKEINQKDFVITEKLHGFSDIYFNNSSSKYFSYSPVNCTAAEKLRNQSAKKLFNSYRIEPVFIKPDVLELSDLIEFFKNPCKSFITNSLGAKYFSNNTNNIEDSEISENNALDKYLLNKDLIHYKMLDKPPEQLYNRMLKEGAIQIGNIGKINFIEQEEFVDSIYNKSYKEFDGLSMKELIADTDEYSFDIVLNSITLSCKIDYMNKDSHWFYFDLGELNGKRAIEIWIKHLAVNCNFPCRTYATTKNKRIAIKPETETAARQKLYSLIKIYNQGLLQPIAFFPNTSYAYATDTKNKLEKARNSFESNRFKVNEDVDLYIKQCFDNTVFEGELFNNFKILSKEIFCNFWQNEKGQTNE